MRKNKYFVILFPPFPQFLMAKDEEMEPNSSSGLWVPVGHWLL